MLSRDFHNDQDSTSAAYFPSWETDNPFYWLVQLEFFPPQVSDKSLNLMIRDILPSKAENDFDFFWSNELKKKDKQNK